MRTPNNDPLGSQADRAHPQPLPQAGGGQEGHPHPLPPAEGELESRAQHLPLAGGERDLPSASEASRSGVGHRATGKGGKAEPERKCILSGEHGARGALVPIEPGGQPRAGSS